MWLLDHNLPRQLGPKLIAALPDVDESFQGDLPVDAYCWMIYKNVNASLAKAVQRLAEEVEGALSGNPVPVSAPASDEPPTPRTTSGVTQGDVGKSPE